jgi:beta-galactosidase
MSNGIHIGSAWYPEQWDETRWAEDLRLMQAASLNLVRVGEFAWSALEAQEGIYTLDWLERAITLAGEYSMECVIGTPTAAPPAWLTQRYPETLAVGENGRRTQHGERCHYSAASSTYRRFCSSIADALAQRFAQHPNVIAWQIDNEYQTISFDEETRAAFHTWLKLRYGTLDALNRAWTTRYWSQEYSDWSQIPFVLHGNPNPGLALAARRFATQVYVDYQQTQIDALRAHAAQPIYHDLIAGHDSFDYYEVTRALDFVAWNHYIPVGHLDPISSGAMHDVMRGMKRRAYWMTELQPGRVNWNDINTDLDRGETARVAWHALAHGADSLSYWQWRSPLNGQEQYHGTLIAQDGTPRPIYDEIVALAAQVRAVSDVLAGTQPIAQCAILHSYEDRWCINLQRHHRDFDPMTQLMSYYRPLAQQTQSVDIVPVQAEINNYALVIAPSLHLLTPDCAAHLLAYVEGGGHLLLGARSGMKDGDNALLPLRQPGHLAQAAGVYVEEYYALTQPVAVSGMLGSGSASVWAEWLHPIAPDVEVLLRYSGHSWLEGTAAATTRRYGKGRITLVGAWLDDALMTRLIAWATEDIQPVFEHLPPMVEVGRRVGSEHTVYIVINHASHEQSVPLPEPCINLLDQSQHGGSLGLAGQGVAVLVPLRQSHVQKVMP